MLDIFTVSATIKQKNITQEENIRHYETEKYTGRAGDDRRQ